MARVSEGTRDHCRHCGQVIEFTQDPEHPRGYSGHRRWFHLTDLGLVQLCPGLEVPYPDTHPSAGETNTFASPKAMPKSYCMESMQNRSWYSSYCLRPIKDEDLMMCGIHAGHVKRQKKKEEEREQRQEQTQYLAEVLTEVSKHIEAEYGLETRLAMRYWQGHGPWFPPTPTGDLVVDPQALMKTLDGLRDEEAF